MKSDFIYEGLQGLRIAVNCLDHFCNNRVICIEIVSVQEICSKGHFSPKSGRLRQKKLKLQIQQ